MTTLEQMAVDVFSEGADLGYEAPFWVYFGEKDESEHETISVFEMAQLNDLACAMFDHGPVMGVEEITRRIREDIQY